MNTIKQQDNGITGVMKFALSQTPSTMGRRIRSEIELATIFKTGRWKVRSSIENLVEKGILVRRKGSGTYVRKIPEISPEERRYISETFKAISPDLLFADPGNCKPVSRLQMTLGQKQLHLELWGDLHVPTASVTSQIIMAGIVSRTNEVRHSLTVHSLVQSPNVPLSVPEIAHRLADNPCDGYIVASRWADEFSEALRSVDRLQAPTIYFSHGSCPIRHEPFVMSDTVEAIERAVQILAGEGYRRIAMIGLDKLESLLMEAERSTYDRAMGLAGLEYRACVFSDLGISNCIATVRKLMGRSDSPDAIYVSDDHLLDGVTEALFGLELLPGRDIGVITFSNRHGLSLPKGFEWSRMEFDPDELGQLLVDNLIKMIQTAGTRVKTMSIHGSWRPGRTHQRAAERVAVNSD
ncbi:MAG: substrate-binding domain-containing protein [Phycisphaerae bacterium]